MSPHWYLSCLRIGFFVFAFSLAAPSPERWAVPGTDWVFSTSQVECVGWMNALSVWTLKLLKTSPPILLVSSCTAPFLTYVALATLIFSLFVAGTKSPPDSRPSSGHLRLSGHFHPSPLHLAWWTWHTLWAPDALFTLRGQIALWYTLGGDSIFLSWQFSGM